MGKTFTEASYGNVTLNLKSVNGRVSNSLNPDQDRQNVGPDLGSNCLQRLSADNERHQANK